MTTKFCTYQDSFAVLECAKFCCHWTEMTKDINKFILVEFENGLEISWIWQVHGKGTRAAHKQPRKGRLKFCIYSIHQNQELDHQVLVLYMYQIHKFGHNFFICRCPGI